MTAGLELSSEILSLQPHILLLISLAISVAYLVSSFFLSRKIEARYKALQVKYQATVPSRDLRQPDTTLSSWMNAYRELEQRYRQTVDILESERRNFSAQISIMRSELEAMKRKSEEMSNEVASWRRKYEELKQFYDSLQPPQQIVLNEYHRVVNKILERRKHLDTTIVDRILAEAYADLQRGNAGTAKRLVELADRLLSEELMLDRLRRLYQIGYRSTYQHPMP